MVKLAIYGFKKNCETRMTKTIIGFDPKPKIESLDRSRKREASSNGLIQKTHKHKSYLCRTTDGVLLDQPDEARKKLTK